MKKKFKAELQAGHQEDAVEVPFDPAEAWGVAPGQLWRGRKGHRILAILNGISFSGFVVSRQRRWFLLIDEDIKHEAGVSIGDVVTITLAPADGIHN